MARERIRRPASLADRYGSLGEGLGWTTIHDLYERDLVEEAYRMALETGASFGGASLNLFRMIEGEALTRERGAIAPVRSWLQVETIAEELEGVEDLGDAIASTCDEVADRLGWEHSRPTLVSVLTQEADAPWHAARFGYFTPKQPYDKICLPNVVCFDSRQLRETVLHEYTHLVVEGRAGERAPEWLQEGLAMLLEEEPLSRAAEPFLQGREWLYPEELDEAFHGERRDPALYSRVWHAYQQAACIGWYLHSLGGDEAIRKLLSAFGNNSFWQEIKINLLGEAGVEEALRETFGITEDEVFDRAHDWVFEIGEGRIPS